MRTIISKILKLGLLLLASQVLLSNSCNKGSLIGCGQNSGYSFVATAAWSPEKSTYKVGDTLYLTSTIPKTLIDQINTSMVVDYSNSLGIGGNVTLFELDTIQHQPLEAAIKFDVSLLLVKYQFIQINHKALEPLFIKNEQQVMTWKSKLFPNKEAYLLFLYQTC